jgi:hypothetical protein
MSIAARVRLTCRPVRSPVGAAQPDVDFAVFATEARPDETIRLSDEHDRYEWMQPDDRDRCFPEWVGEMYREVLGLMSDA